MLRLLQAAGTGSISPTDVARALDPEGAARGWPGLLPRVRRIATRLATAGGIEMLRKGQPVQPAEARGVIRLRLRAEPPTAETPAAETPPAGADPA